VKDASIPTVLVKKIFMQDRERKGELVLCRIVGTSGSGMGENFIYIVPEVFPLICLPGGMSKDELQATLDALSASMNAGTLRWNDAKAFFDQMKSAGFPLCGTIGSERSMGMTHRDVFGN
jgi:hypothetical protein